MDQMTFAVNPLPQTLLVLLTERNRTPPCRAAELSQESTADFTQSGMGTVRTWPPAVPTSMSPLRTSRVARFRGAIRTVTPTQFSMYAVRISNRITREMAYP
jgi:hypothetical protein